MSSSTVFCPRLKSSIVKGFERKWKLKYPDGYQTLFNILGSISCCSHTSFLALQHDWIGITGRACIKGFSPSVQRQYDPV